MGDDPAPATASGSCHSIESSIDRRIAKTHDFVVVQNTGKKTPASTEILFLEKFNLIYETLYSHRFALLRAL